MRALANATDAGTSHMTADRRAVFVDSGALLWPCSPSPDFKMSVQIRYDNLRYFMRPPEAGIVFSAADSKNLEAIVLSPDLGAVAWKRVVNGNERIVFRSKTGSMTRIGKSFWLQVSAHQGRLRAFVGGDLRLMRPLIDEPYDVAPTGMAGIITSAPGAWFTWGAGGASAFPKYTVPPYPLTDSSGTTTQSAKLPSRADYLGALSRLADKHPVERVDDPSYAALACVVASRMSNDPRWVSGYLEHAHRVLTAYVHQGRVPQGFTTFYPDVTVVAEAQRQGLLSTDEVAVIPKWAAETVLKGQYERGAMNRALGNLLGIAPALKLAGNFPERQTAVRIQKLVESDFAQYGYAPLEDATNYELISLQFASLYADQSAPLWWSQTGFRDAFRNVAELVSPSGRFPAFGDDDEGHPGHLLEILTVAFDRWPDDHIRDAITRVWMDSYYSENYDPHAYIGQEMLGLALAAKRSEGQPDSSMVPPPLFKAVLTSRADGTPSKAVLQMGNTYAAFDLFSGGEHGHNDAFALVSLEHNGKVLLGDNGRYARDAYFHNKPLITLNTTPAPFPARLEEQSRRMLQNSDREGQWTFYHLPLNGHWVWGNFAGNLSLPALSDLEAHPDIPTRFAYDPTKQSDIVFDLNGTGSVQVELAGLTLVDGTRRSRLDFTPGADGLNAEAKTSFHGFPVHAWNIAIPPEGQYVGGKTAVSIRSTSMPHGWIDFWLRLSPAPDSNVVLHSVVLGDGDGYPKRWVQADNVNGEVKASVDTLGSIPHLSIIQDLVDGVGVTIPVERDVILPLPGLLWVRDTARIRVGIRNRFGPVWYTANPRKNATRVRSSTGLVLMFSGQDAIALNGRRTFGMTNEEAVFSSVQGGTTDRRKPIDTLLVADGTTWREIFRQGEASVWTDGKRYIGRNPDHIALHFGALTTSESIFVRFK